ncbi:DUF4178 domain-containing protein [Tropicimonas sp.]|uniref:DUF4178 domain-containing protein n=1 Tax=Tropicimonas sp. TaxID=2067044 RepID=UPI003A877454
MANCPNCGDRLPQRFDAALMAVCDSCHSTVYRVDGRLLTAGLAGEMHEAPMLADLNSRLRIGTEWLDVAGHARFSYGPGWWDELWAVRPDGTGRWVSIDEGDVVVQDRLETPAGPMPQRPALGLRLSWRGQPFTATEIDTGRCVALRGVFPERLAIDDRFGYVNLSSAGGALLSAETHAGTTDWFAGHWLDPFTLEVKRR